MRHVLSFVFLVALWPAHLAAHSWMGDAAPLTSDSVEALVGQLEAFEPVEIFSPPSEENALDFLEEVSLRMEDPSGDLARILFMYEAIRQGAVSAGQYSDGTPPFAWVELILLEDFQPVSAQFDRIDTWFHAQLEAADR